MRDCSMLREGSRQDSTGRPQKSTALTAWLLTTPMGKVDLRWPTLWEPVTMCTVQRNKSWLIFKSWYFIEITLYFPYKNSFLNCLFFKKGKDSSCKFNLQFWGRGSLFMYLFLPYYPSTSWHMQFTPLLYRVSGNGTCKQYRSFSPKKLMPWETFIIF